MTPGSTAVRRTAIVTTDESLPLDAIILDVDVLAGSPTQGLEVLHELRGMSEDFVLIALTRSHSHSLRRKATEAGADDFFVAPVDFDELRLVLERALDQRRIQIENRRLREQIAQKYSFCELIGGSEPMRRVYDAITRVADSTTTILIRGESGSGKELVARAIVMTGPRSEQPFISLNCGAIPESLIEAELFGHEKGSFTGADASRPGHIEAAHGGTLFLDEIGSLPLPLQSKLLRVLEDRAVQRIGGRSAKKV